jgi:hypothetical protein
MCCLGWFTFAPQLIHLIKMVVDGEKTRRGYNRAARHHDHISMKKKISMDFRDWKEQNF